MPRVLVFFLLFLGLVIPALAQTSDLQTILRANQKAVERASRKTVAPVLTALVESELDAVPGFLKNWRQKNVWLRKEDGHFFYVEDAKADPIRLIDISTGQVAGEAQKADLKNLKPNSGVRSMIAAALVRFQLTDDVPAQRIAALEAIERNPDASHLAVLRGRVENESVPEIKSRIQRLERLLTIRFDKDTASRTAAINSFSGDTNVDVRAVLNTVLQTRMEVIESVPENANVARRLRVGTDIELDAAYDLLVQKGLAPKRISVQERNEALIANIKEGTVAEIPVSMLSDEKTRVSAYQKLASMELVSPFITNEERNQMLADHVFFEQFIESESELTDAARETVNSINARVKLFGIFDLGLDALSLASIYFLAAIGLAITFGVMGVINMAHGEFIMIGAYTGYVVQQFVPDYTLSIIIALPLAFGVAFVAGVALERLVIRHLMHRPLETLLATFGVSIALQQLAKNIFGTQARPLTSPQWLDGAWVLNDVISISYIRIAIFVLALLILVFLLFVLNRTRLGLEVRAVTQNPRMASSMGVNPDRINMLTFGLGSGIAGIAGVAIGLFAQVTSELGSGYIVQSFMTVVVGGVGNIWGTLAGAGMIGGLQKVIEFFNPSNTLAAQTYMIIFIIIFIQFKPKGIIALKGRAAGD